MTTPDKQAREALIERCRAVYQKMGRDAMLRQNDPVQTLAAFADELISERPYIIGFNAGWEAALRTPAEETEAVARAGEPKWGAYWYGSEPNKGANIWTLNRYGMRSDLILNVGPDKEHLHLARTICTLHNQRAFTTPPVDEAKVRVAEYRFPKIGDIMRFINANGYDEERARAASVFDTTRNYTVSYVSIGSWSTTLGFDEVDGRWNSVMFAPAPAVDEKQGEGR